MKHFSQLLSIKIFEKKHPYLPDLPAWMDNI